MHQQAHNVARAPPRECPQHTTLRMRQGSGRRGSRRDEAGLTAQEGGTGAQEDQEGMRQDRWSAAGEGSGQSGLKGSMQDEGSDGVRA